MRVIDVHVHTRGDENPKKLLKAMDAAGVEKVVLFAPSPNEEKGQRERTKAVLRIAKASPKRLLPFTWIDPRHDGCTDELDWAVRKGGCVGLKMIPNHWYPYDDCAMRIYEKVQKLRIPILFHSGILWGYMDSSRFCRPCFYEALLHFPKVKFALAHISWPWTDECIATAGRFRAAAGYDEKRMQMYIDCTPGTPMFYREEALDRAFRYLGAGRLMYGSDSRAGSSAAELGRHVRSDTQFLRDHLALTEAECQRFFAGSFEDMMKPMK